MRITTKLKPFAALIFLLQLVAGSIWAQDRSHPLQLNFSKVCARLLQDEAPLSRQVLVYWEAFEESYNRYRRFAGEVPLAPEADITEERSEDNDPFLILQGVIEHEFAGWQPRVRPIGQPKYNDFALTEKALNQLIEKNDSGAVVLKVAAIIEAMEVAVETKTFPTYFEAQTLLRISKKLKTYFEQLEVKTPGAKEYLLSLQADFDRRARDMKLASTIFTFVMLFSSYNHSLHIGEQNLKMVLLSPSGLKYTYKHFLSMIRSLHHHHAYVYSNAPKFYKGGDEDDNNYDKMIYISLRSVFEYVVEYYESIEWRRVPIEIQSEFYQLEDDLETKKNKRARGNN